MEAILNALVPVTFFAMLGLERVFPARRLPTVKAWLAKGIAWFFLSGVLNGVIPALIVHGASSLHLVRPSPLGTLSGALVAFLLADLLNYAIHRWMHRVDVVWRYTHQMHHSAERVDIAGAAYVHPLEVSITVAMTAVVAVALGLSPDSAALAGFAGFFYAMFQHLNVRTPRWLGYVIQRPESHSVHHARGVHAYNFGNFPLWDIVFGTFRNPEGFEAEAGFWDGASREVLPMLLGRDVTRPPARTAGAVSSALGAA